MDEPYRGDAASGATRRRWAAAVALAGLSLCGVLLAAEQEPVKEAHPAAAEAALSAGREAYGAGDYEVALGAFQEAEKAGARFGLLFYQMGFCQGALGEPQAQQELVERAVPYFEADVQSGQADVNSYYYLAAIYYEMPDRAKASRVIDKAIQADAAGKLGDDLDGEEWFRLGRLYSFALELEPPGESERRGKLDEQRLKSYGKAAERLSKTRDANRVYLSLALDEVGRAAAKDGRWADAIDAYSRVSALDPTKPAPAQALLRLGTDLSARGDLQGAISAWRGIRGPDGPKTQANYGMHLLEQVLAHGELPTTFEGTALAALDAAALERGILDAAEFLRTAAAGEEEEAGGFSADPAEVKTQRGIFLALMLTYLERGSDLRTFTVQHQLVPLVFGER